MWSKQLMKGVPRRVIRTLRRFAFVLLGGLLLLLLLSLDRSDRASLWRLLP